MMAKAGHMLALVAMLLDNAAAGSIVAVRVGVNFSENLGSVLHCANELAAYIQQSSGHR